MSRAILLASSCDRAAAMRVVATVECPPDLIVTSPSAKARETAAFAVRGRYVPMFDEPLLAARAPEEAGIDILARFVQGLRAVCASDERARSVLVVVDGLDVLGAAAFTLEEAGIERLADDLELALPFP